MSLMSETEEELEFWIAQVFKGDEEAASTWLGRPMEDFDGRTPRELIEAGEESTVSEILATFYTGAFL